MTISFTQAAIPTNTRAGREAAPNPFAEAFPCDEKALSFVVAEKDSTEFRRILRWVREAAHKVDRTGRVHTADLPDGTVQVTVWTVERITRGGSEDETAEAEAVESDALLAE